MTLRVMLNISRPTLLLATDRKSSAPSGPKILIFKTSVADPDPNPDPPDPHFFMGPLDPDPLVRGMNPDPDPDLDPSITKQNK